MFNLFNDAISGVINTEHQASMLHCKELKKGNVRGLLKEIPKREAVLKLYFP